MQGSGCSSSFEDTREGSFGGPDNRGSVRRAQPDVGGTRAGASESREQVLHASFDLGRHMKRRGSGWHRHGYDYEDDERTILFHGKIPAVLRMIVDRVNNLYHKVIRDRRSGEVLYEFSPSPEELLDELLPATVRVRLFQAFTDAAVSEQVARMVAMKAATDAAEDMIKRLTMKYNRARQTQVTMELLDIVGGANALA